MYATLDSPNCYQRGPAKLDSKVIKDPEPYISISVKQASELQGEGEPQFDEVMNIVLSPEEAKGLARTLEGWLSTLAHENLSGLYDDLAIKWVGKTCTLDGKEAVIGAAHLPGAAAIWNNENRSVYPWTLVNRIMEKDGAFHS